MWLQSCGPGSPANAARESLKLNSDLASQCEAHKPLVCLKPDVWGTAVCQKWLWTREGSVLTKTVTAGGTTEHCVKPSSTNQTFLHFKLKSAFLLVERLYRRPEEFLRVFCFAELSQ